MAKNKSKLTVQKVGSQEPKEEIKEVEVAPQEESLPEPEPQEAPVESPKLPSKLELLQEEAVSFGMPKEDAKEFKSEKMLTLMLNTLRAKSVVAPAVVVEDKIDLVEERKIEKLWRNKAEKQKEFFDSLPKVRIIIPCEGEEKPGVIEEKIVDGKMQTVVVSGSVWSKTFNGYRVIVPKGVYCTVSEAIADNIAQEFNQVQESNKQFSIDRIDPETGRPVSEML